MNITRLLILVLFSALLMLSSISCSGKKSPSVPGEDPPDLLVETSREATTRIAEAEETSAEAKRLHTYGDIESARIEYEKAVDILLNLPLEIGGVDENEHVRSLLADAVAAIHDIEQAQRAAMTEQAERAMGIEPGEEDIRDASEQGEEAAVDELTVDPLLAELETEAVETVSSREGPQEQKFEFPIEYNTRVESLVRMFEGKKHDWFQRSLDRSGRYLPMIRRTFAKYDVPEELVALAMVESAFRPRAISRAGARGIWQFIRGTGRLYGLRSDFWIDDRFDPEKATDAAARHLRDLHDQFGDWYLAMAAYNSGPRRVQRAMRRTGSRDFWTLAKRRTLPRETRSYVPLILAAMVISKDPGAHGFTAPIESEQGYEVVALDYAVDLNTAAKAAGTSLEEMKLLNPELRRWVTPMDAAYDLKIPAGSKEAFCEALDAIPREQRVRYGSHVVRRGDTLSRIAQRYGTTISAVATANGLSRRSVIHPGQSLTIPVIGGGRGSADVPVAVTTRHNRVVDGNVYVVRRGDTLGRISSSFGVPLGRLRKWNGMSARETTIRPGQRLVVQAGGAGVASSGASDAPISSPGDESKVQPKGGVPTAHVPASEETTVPASGTYLVKVGDSLGRIADTHRMGLTELRRLNKMGRRTTRIYPGQRLVVRAQATSENGAGNDRGEPRLQAQKLRYRIRRGDTLARIAERFGVSIDEIRKWNRIERDRIIAGRSLTIYTDEQ